MQHKRKQTSKKKEKDAGKIHTCNPYLLRSRRKPPQRRSLRSLRKASVRPAAVEKLHTIAATVYGKLDMLFQNHSYKPGDLPKKLDSIFEEQIKMLQVAIAEGRNKCENHCGINHYDAISCESCNATKPTCFGYNCDSSEKWKDALNELYDYVKSLNKEPEVWASALRQVPTFSHCTAERYRRYSVTKLAQNDGFEGNGRGCLSLRTT
ncbi:izumo sperm-egg fusion protein 4 isoform X3 [Erythrolamprus reginae]|uniref:izumo sperm-egg fusion protein 4 isoform X3 n=1 Tax=Erythrolamprus reginae TaxID=121349 RepID=UPI00396C7B6A